MVAHSNQHLYNTLELSPLLKPNKYGSKTYEIKFSVIFFILIHKTDKNVHIIEFCERNWFSTKQHFTFVSDEALDMVIFRSLLQLNQWHSTENRFNVWSKQELLSIDEYLLSQCAQYGILPQKKIEEKIGDRIIEVCKSGANILSDVYKPLSKEGRFEVYILNSLLALPKIKKKYRSDFDKIQNHVVSSLILEGTLLPVDFDTETLIDFIDSRYKFFYNEIEYLYTSDSYIPGAIYNVFYENPLQLTPQKSFDLGELIVFNYVLGQMMKYNSEASLTI